MPDLETIRSLLYDPPSSLTWNRLWGALKKFSPKMLEDVVIPYVQSHLAQWPAGQRIVQSELKPVIFGGNAPDQALKATAWLLFPLSDHLRVQNRRLTSAELIHLSNNAHLKHLTHLTLSLGSDISQDALVCFGLSRHLTRLESLTLSGVTFSVPSARALFSGPWFSSLQQLTLTSVTFAGPVDHPLGLVNLTAMSLINSEVAPFVESMHSQVPLEKLEMRGTSAAKSLKLLIRMAPVLKSLAFSSWSREDPLGVVASYLPLRDHLESLSIGHVHWAEPFKMMQGKRWHRLRRIDLKGCDLTPERVRTLCALSSLPALEELNVSFVPVGDCVVEALGEGVLGKHLSALGLRGTSLSRGGLRSLLAHESFKALKALDIRSNPRLGVTGLRLLGQEHRLIAIESLRLNGNALTDELVALIEGNPSFGALSQLMVLPCALSIQGVFMRMTSQSPVTCRRVLTDFLDGYFERKDLFGYLKSQGVKVPSRERDKGNLIAVMIGHVYDDPEQLAQLLISPITLRKLSSKTLRATLKRARVKGFSKLGRAALEARIRMVLGEDGAGLLSA